MKKLSQFLDKPEHEFYSLNFLLADNTESVPRNTLVDLSKKADSLHYASRDFQTFLFNKHLSRLVRHTDRLTDSLNLFEE